jgi:hypothetical protein
MRVCVCGDLAVVAAQWERVHCETGIELLTLESVPRGAGQSLSAIFVRWRQIQKRKTNKTKKNTNKQRELPQLITSTALRSNPSASSTWLWMTREGGV